MASGPLDGVRVLEFGQIIAGPLGCSLLSDLGAEVIKVEPPQGEPWRLNAQFMPGESKGFQALNRGKKSLAIDVGRPEAREAIYRLMPSVDVVVINYRPDVARRLGIDYETLSKIRTDLVYCDNTAFGRKGDRADLPGYDIVVQALSGLMAMVGKFDDKGLPQTPLAFADILTAYAIVGGVCAALFERARSGRGQKLETSLLVNSLMLQGAQFMSLPAADAELRASFFTTRDEALARGMSFAELRAKVNASMTPSGTTGNSSGNVYYRTFHTSDGVIAVGALSAGLREKVRQVLNLEHNRDAPDYDPTDPAQQETDRRIVAAVEALIASRSCDYWEEAFRKGGVPVSRVNFPPEMLEHPQVTANDYAVELQHELSGPQWMVAPPWKMSLTPPAAQSAAPPLGRDTDSILSAAGYSAEEIESMRAAGLIR
jgi:CoA:oxalate CoA-transferase